MAFQLKVQMWQYWLCNENVSGVAQLESMNTVEYCHTGLKYVRKKKGPSQACQCCLLLLDFRFFSFFVYTTLCAL